MVPIIYPHDYPNHLPPTAVYLPDNLLGTRLFDFADNAKEQQIYAFIQWLKRDGSG